MYEGGTGIFGAMQEEDRQSDYQYLKQVDEKDPDSIYNLLFREYDKENRS